MTGYVHFGSDVNVPAADIVGVFDIERVTEFSGAANDYLAACQKSGGIYYVSLDLPRSFVTAADKTYVTNVSAATILNRIKFIKNKT